MPALPANNQRVVGTCRPLLALTLFVLGFGLTGCESTQPANNGSDARMAAYVELVLPARIEIQRYLTKPVSFAGNGTADGLEVILAAYDAADDLTKVVGTFHFELQTRRMSDRIGERVAFWPVEINSVTSMHTYRDHLSRFYDFPLQLDGEPLKPGLYTLTVWLHLPTGRRLFDEYEFTYDGEGAPPVE